ncbi:2-oxo-4-hydroxy-4-carboxy-5-ureidoimidazoline decarboxylase [Pokkaliibacter sp. CJK22405]|uniref:2-oxo-4-hydroxy-4-carboxy-5-ureidoimidazoline decarboxylase n=1 Tax=Pokkaliibacter sp. CJK22405 TaxID=3384615 RepID=UPI003984A584
MFTSMLNTYSPQDLRRHLYNTCSSEQWVEQVVMESPFGSESTFVQAVDKAFKSMTPAQWLEAFAGHPMIGDVDSLRKKYADTRKQASNEQSSVAEASEETLQRLAELNQAYFQRHGFIFIVFASGKSADEMLALLEERLPRTTEEETAAAAQEQRKITALRLSQWLKTPWLAKELA